MKQTEQTNGQARTPARGIEAWFAHTVGILLLVIIAALTGLALRFHRRSGLAEARLAETAAALKRTESALDVLGSEGMGLVARLPRESLQRTAATLDGGEVELLELPPELGEMVGLEAGDVVRVGVAASQPGGAQ